MNFAALALILATVVAQAPPAQPPSQAQPAPAPSAGDLALRRGDFDAAYAAYNSAAAANPSDADAALGLGTIDLYRNDLASAKTYLTKAAELDPANPRIQSRLRVLAARTPNDADFQITMSRERVDVPFLATDPLPVLHATINGAEATLFLDTGATSIDLTPEAAKRLNVPTHAGGQGVFAGGLSAQVSTGRIDSVAFDGLTVRGIDADILPAPVELGGRKLDGAIGTTFLYHFLSTIDYVHGRLTLRRRSASNAFETEARMNGAVAVPMWLVGDHFLFAQGHVGETPVALFNIDTGGEGVGVQLTKAALDAARIVPDATKSIKFTGGGGDARAEPFVAPSVSLGTFTVANVPGLYFPDGDQFKIFPFDVAGTLSHEYFRHTELTFDFAAMKLVVAPAK